MEGAKLLKCSEFGDAIIKTCNPFFWINAKREPKGSRFYLLCTGLSIIK